MESSSIDKCFTFNSESLVNSESNLTTAESETSVLNDECSRIVTTDASACDSPKKSRLSIPQNVDINVSSESSFMTRQVPSPVSCQCTIECGNRKNSSSDVSSSYRVINGSSSNPDHLLDNKFINQDCGDTDSFIEIENCLKITSAVMKCSRQKDTSDITEESNKFDVDDAENASSFTEMKNSSRPGTEVLSSVGLIHKKSSSEFNESSTSYVGSCAKLVSSVTDDSHSNKMLDFVVPVDNVNAIQDGRVGNFYEAAECNLEVPTDSSCASKMSTFAQPEVAKSSPSKSTDFHALESEAINQEYVSAKRELPSFNEIQPFGNDLVQKKNAHSESNRVFDVTNRLEENDESEKLELNKSNSKTFDSGKSITCEEKSDNSFVSELISSENINDFFDDVYDIDYRNRVHSSRSNLKDFIVNSVNDKDFGSAPSSVRSQYVESWGRIRNRSAGFDNLGLPNSYVSQVSTNVTVRSSLKKTINEDIDQEYPSCKKSKKGIKFDSVSVYYFPRTQGFTCIPSQGGSTLGMSWNHSHSRKFSLGEHAAEQRRAHRQLCAQQFSSTRNWNEISNLSSEDSDSDEIISDSEMDYENYNFLQPIPTRERRAMLRAAGIHKIDSVEKDECRSIRLSREFCGCTCQVYCDPEKCVCAQAGIKCQVDRMNFPCSCSREGCANENGRIEFNPVRVRTHYIHTLMRLETEKKKEEEERRNRLMLNSLESSQLSYPASSTTSNVAGNGATNFSYQNSLLSFYSQPSAYEIASSSSADSQCFNVNYSIPNDQYILPSVSEMSSYHQSNSADTRLDTDNTTTTEYCCSDDLLVSHYGNCIKPPENQNFIIRDLTSNSEINVGNDSFNSESFIPSGGESYEQQADTASQGENLEIV